jgi:hypothetical protein
VPSRTVIVWWLDLQLHVYKDENKLGAVESRDRMVVRFKFENEDTKTGTINGTENYSPFGALMLFSVSRSWLCPRFVLIIVLPRFAL